MRIVLFVSGPNLNWFISTSAENFFVLFDWATCSSVELSWLFVLTITLNVEFTKIIYLLDRLIIGLISSYYLKVYKHKMPKTSFILDGWEYQIIGIGMRNETTLRESCERRKLVEIPISTLKSKYGKYLENMGASSIATEYSLVYPYSILLDDTFILSRYFLGFLFY